MNNTIYFFGNFNDGYTQYPDDFTKGIFAEGVPEYAKTSLTINRDCDIVYYIYVRRLYGKTNHYIGIAISFNGVYTTDIRSLFALFEEIITDTAISGKLLEISENGEIQSRVTQLCYHAKETERLSGIISNNISDGKISFSRLPPLNYAAGKDDLVALPENASWTEISEAIKINNVIHFLKNSDYDTLALQNYTGKLKNLHNENLKLRESNKQLESDIKKIQKQKKQFQIVTVLSIFLFLGIFLLFSLNADLKTARNTISDLKHKIDSQENTILKLEKDKIGLNNLVTTKNVKINELEEKVKSLDFTVKDLNDDIARLRQANSAMESDRNRWKNEYNTLKVKYGNLEKKYSNKNGGNTPQKPTYRTDIEEKPYISPKSVTIGVGETYQLQLYPASLRPEITRWEVDNDKILSISQSGKIKGKRQGQTNVWVYYRSEVKRCAVTVK